MSQSDNSAASTVTCCPVQYVDMASLEDNNEDDAVETMVNEEPIAAVVQEEVELMLKRTMQAIDCNTEVLDMLLQLNRICNRKSEDKLK